MVNMVRNITGNNASSTVTTKISPKYHHTLVKVPETPPKSPTKSLKKRPAQKTHPKGVNFVHQRYMQTDDNTYSRPFCGVMSWDQG